MMFRKTTVVQLEQI